MALVLPTTMIEVPEGQEWIIDMVTNMLVEVLASIVSRRDRPSGDDSGKESMLQRRGERNLDATESGWKRHLAWSINKNRKF